VRRLGRLLGFDQPQEIRFFLVIAGWGLLTGIVYWFVSYEPAGTVLLLGLAAAGGLIAVRLIAVRRAGAARARTSADTELDPWREDASAGGTGGIDRPFDDPRGVIPDPTLAPFAVGLGAALIATGPVYGLATVAVGALPLLWGTVAWLAAARGEYETARSAAQGEDETARSAATPDAPEPVRDGRAPPDPA
jgi:hypothetical protein